MDPEKEVMRRLAELGVDDLKTVHTELKLADITDESKKDNESYIRKMIMRHLSSDTVVDAEDEGLSTYLFLNTFMKTLVKTQDPDLKDKKPDDDKEDEKPSDDKIETKTEISSLNPTKENPDDNNNNVKQDDSVLKFQKQEEDLMKNSFWRKDLKIKGQIGSPGEKGKLTFISVVRKIERATKQRYRDPEICEAVIEMVSPELRLRSLLEGKFDLTLPQLRRILRCHYKEDEATEMYTQLTNLSQEEGTTADDFINDVIILRDKILFTSKEEDCDFAYPESIVRRQSTHAIVTGLRDDNIKSEVKAVLSSGKQLDDVELLEVVNKSMREEAERKRKLKKGAKKSANVNVVGEKEDSITTRKQKETKENPIVAELKEIKAGLSEISNLKADVEALKGNVVGEETTAPRKQFPDKENLIVAELKEIRAGLSEISDLKTDVEVLKECMRNIGGGVNPNGFQGGKKALYGCKKCREQNLRGCNHCFKCCESGHKKENCPN
jgi:hypothetical protein